LGADAGAQAPSPQAPAAQGAGAASHSYDELEATARRLAAGIDMPADRQALALERLRTAFQRGKIAAFSAGTGINGVFAYQLGEGGFLVKVKKGKGLASILSEPADIPMKLKSVTFGAQVGGGSEWGFGVILGLRDRAAFGGPYKGDTRGAAAGESSVSITKLVKKGFPPGDPMYNELYMIGAASGLSAGAAIGDLNIETF
jgi:hypothetical protein